jgi:putative nucleotidyltransferase with HDIG domain
MPMNLANPTKEGQAVVAPKNSGARARVLNPAERYLNDVSRLPPAPMLVTELLTLFREPDRDIDHVVKLISFEPSLTAQILRICNSACFASEQPPGDIFEAVSRMGFYQVYCLVVSIFGARTRAMEGADKGVNVEELWRHSVAVAVSASVVEEEVGQAKAVAFTAGLLHDIGKLVLASAEREPYARLIQSAKEQSVELIVLERAAFGTDHAELGGELMHRWNLPPEIVAAVRYHHQLEASPPYEQLAAVVQVGNMIAHQLFAEDSANTHPLKPSNAALDVLLLSPDDVPRLLAKTQEEMETVKGTLEL